MLFFAPEIVMTDEEFRLLQNFVNQYCGLHFTEDSRYLLEKRLGKRVQHLNLKNFKDYYYFLRYNQSKDQELNEVVNVLTTNETYFFREEFQLRTFREEILPELRSKKEAEGNKKLRIWSAGCSTGEEPYTVAMLLLDIPAFRDWQIDIIGTDISQRVLQIARKGVYGSSSFRCTEPAILRRFFSEVEGGKFRINDEVRNLVTISHLNLFDIPRVAILGSMDVIFCRNVIIYFDATGKKRVIENFYQRLRPEGFLLLGHSESLMNITNAFVLRHFRHDMVYQRPPTVTELKEVEG